MRIWPPHDVRMDRAGLDFAPRLTCRNATCNGASVSAEGIMLDEWQEEKERFLAAHPCVEIIDEGSRG